MFFEKISLVEFHDIDIYAKREYNIKYRSSTIGEAYDNNILRTQFFV